MSRVAALESEQQAHQSEAERLLQAAVRRAEERAQVLHVEPLLAEVARTAQELSAAQARLEGLGAECQDLKEKLAAATAAADAAASPVAQSPATRMTAGRRHLPLQRATVDVHHHARGQGQPGG